VRAFVDTNIPMYAAGREHPSKLPSIALLGRVAEGEIDAVIDAEVLQEILHRFSALDHLDQGLLVFDAFEKIVDEVLPVEHQDVVAARELLEGRREITARDAIHVAVMLRHGISVIFSYDRHFDGMAGIERREP
jgi:hypothetical protein